MAYVDVHLEEAADTVCASNGERYALGGVKYIHEGSGDFSIFANRLAHRGSSEETYRFSASLNLVSDITATVKVEVGVWDASTSGVTILDDFTLEVVAVSVSLGSVVVSGIVTLAAGPSELELFLTSSEDATTVTVQRLAMDLVRVS